VIRGDPRRAGYCRGTGFTAMAAEALEESLTLDPDFEHPQCLLTLQIGVPWAHMKYYHCFSIHPLIPPPTPRRGPCPPPAGPPSPCTVAPPRPPPPAPPAPRAPIAGPRGGGEGNETTGAPMALVVGRRGVGLHAQVLPRSFMSRKCSLAPEGELGKRGPSPAHSVPTTQAPPLHPGPAAAPGPRRPPGPAPPAAPSPGRPPGPSHTRGPKGACGGGADGPPPPPGGKGGNEEYGSASCNRGIGHENATSEHQQDL